jgi:hypothetical protein
VPRLERSASNAGALRIAIPREMVNLKANWLNINSARCSVLGARCSVLRAPVLSAASQYVRAGMRGLARPGGLNEESVLLPQVASSGRDDRSFADHNFAILLQCLPNVVLAYKVCGLF